MWARSRERAGCDGTRLHHLRHFYASGLIAAGCDVVTAQRPLGALRRLGHAEQLRAPVAVGSGPDAAAAAGMLATVLTAADFMRTSEQV